MRIKNETIFVASDLGRVIEAAPGSKLLRKVIDVLRPERSGISGESIELEGHEISKGLLAAELFRNGTPSKLVKFLIRVLHHFVLMDSRKGFGPGLIGLYRMQDGSVFFIRYFPRHALSELGARLAWPYQSDLPFKVLLAHSFELGFYDTDLRDPEIQKMLATNEPPAGIVLLDLNYILVRARERVEALRESLPSDFPVEKWLDAAVMASQVRDEVDSIVKTDEVKKGE
jgi:hypothetical protein